MRMLFCLTALLFAASPAVAGEVNSLTTQEKEQGFELLFNGKDFDGWKQSGNWVIEDDAVFRADKGGSLVYSERKVPDNFELRFEWKVAPKSNSGLYYRPTQYEYQILDNDGHSNGTNPRTTAASVYFCMAPSHDATKPVGEWNTGRIVAKGTVVQHWLNGKKVVDFDYSNPEWAEHVELLKRRGGDLTARGAFLSLQDHNDPVWFRSLRLREIPESETVESENIKPAAVPADELAKEQTKVEGIEARRKQQEAQKNK